jgi:hypothetical protein
VLGTLLPSQTGQAGKTNNAYPPIAMSRRLGGSSVGLTQGWGYRKKHESDCENHFHKISCRDCAWQCGRTPYLEDLAASLLSMHAPLEDDPAQIASRIEAAFTGNRGEIWNDSSGIDQAESEAIEAARNALAVPSPF